MASVVCQPVLIAKVGQNWTLPKSTLQMVVDATAHYGVGDITVKWLYGWRCSHVDPHGNAVQNKPNEAALQAP